jgi:small subunit ribosomal protein S15
VVADHQRDTKDTGSPEVQVAMLTARIKDVSEHLDMHKMDHSSRRGLLAMVGNRNSLLRYLQHEDRERYLNLIKRLGLRK